MRRFGLWILIPALLSLTVGLLPSNAVGASRAPSPRYAAAFDIIVAVNDYRGSHGLPPYNVSEILMGTAQAQAQFMASTGSVTHLGPNGINLTQRLINAGYVMEGGFRAENILSISANSSGYDIVHSGYWADSDHQNTMLSPDLTEIGAGVATSGGSGYFVIDCARPSSAGASSSTSGGGGTNATPDTSQYMNAVVTSTPRADGAVYHEVKYGQSLWSIAIAYGTKIDEIKRLNNLSTNDIYLGQKLLIRNLGTVTPSAPTATSTSTQPAVIPTSTYLPTMTSGPTLTETVTQTPEVSGGGGSVAIVIILVIAFLIAGLGVWLGMRKPE
jgi:LysM repeat protein